MNITEKIFALLRQKSMTQGSLIRKVGIPRTRLWRASKGLSKFSDNHIKAISLVLEVTSDYLLDDTKGYPPSNGDRPDHLKVLPEAIKEDVQDRLYGKSVDKIVLAKENIELWTASGQRLATLKRSEELVIEGEGLSLFLRKKG